MLENPMARLILMAVCTLIIPLMSCGGSESSDATVRRAIEESHHTYTEAMKRGDATALASHFTQDAILLPENSDMQRGRDAIQKWFASWVPTTTVQAFDITTMEVTVVGSTAYEVGTYRMTLSPQGFPPISNQGKYLMVWKRATDGHWHILRDMFNTNARPSTQR
jgi:uncharacterized protein (TIGR02246 family)